MSGNGWFGESDTPELMYLVGWILRRYSDISEYEDLLSEAYLNAIRSVRRLSETSGLKWQTVVCKSAEWAAGDFFRSHFNTKRKRTRHGLDIPELFSLDEMIELCDDSSRILPVVEDPGPEVVERVAAEELWERFLVSMDGTPKRHQEAVRRMFAGEPGTKVASDLGVSTAAVYSWRKKALARFREKEVFGDG